MCEKTRAKLSLTLFSLLEKAINDESWENEANVPDFILAEFLVCCFNTFNEMVKKRDKWYSVHLELCNSYFYNTENNKSPETEKICTGAGSELEESSWVSTISLVPRGWISHC